MCRNPGLFEEAMKAVTQRKRADGLLLEAIPEAERTQRSKSRPLPAAALPVLQRGGSVRARFSAAFWRFHGRTHRKET